MISYTVYSSSLSFHGQDRCSLSLCDQEEICTVTLHLGAWWWPLLSAFPIAHVSNFVLKRFSPFPSWTCARFYRESAMVAWDIHAFFSQMSHLCLLLSFDMSRVHFPPFKRPVASRVVAGRIFASYFPTPMVVRWKTTMTAKKCRLDRQRKSLSGGNESRYLVVAPTTFSNPPISPPFCVTHSSRLFSCDGKHWKRSRLWRVNSVLKENSQIIGEMMMEEPASGENSRFASRVFVPKLIAWTRSANCLLRCIIRALDK